MIILNTYNACSLDYIHPFKRNSQDLNGLLLYFKVKNTEEKVRKTFNIPKWHDDKYLLIEWLMKKMKLKTHDLDLTNPHNLAKQILTLTSGKIYQSYLELSKCKHYINIEDIKPYIKQ